MDENKELTVQTAQAVAPSTINWLDPVGMGKLYNFATAMSNSNMLPASYKNKPADVLIAMDLATRMNLPLTAVCQNLYVVQGKPAWSGQFCISAIKSCGKFKNFEFLWLEDGGCMAQAVEVASGKICTSVPITKEMVSGFGWDAKNGSMWNIPGMDKQMFMYRAAAFFVRAHCPELLNGIYTEPEVRDMTSWDGYVQEDIDGNND